MLARLTPATLMLMKGHLSIRSLAAVTVLTACLSPVQANPWREAGIRDGITAKVAGTLAYCREQVGDGDDWIQYYMMKLAVNRDTQALYQSLPKKFRAKQSEKMVQMTMGSCEAFVEKDESFGTRWFVENAIEPAVRGACSSSGTC